MSGAPTPTLDRRGAAFFPEEIVEFAAEGFAEVGVALEPSDFEVRCFQAELLDGGAPVADMDAAEVPGVAPEDKVFVGRRSADRG